MSYTHLNTKQRNIIEVLHKENYSTRHIAKIIGVHHSTVARELHRVEGKYCSALAEEDRKKNASRKGRKTKLSPQTANTIQTKLQETWSPEQVAGRIFPKKISTKTIYNWIHKGMIHVKKTWLRRKGKKPKSQETRGKFIVGKSIHERSPEVQTRTSFGHWELDTMVSSRGQSKGCFATFVERKTRFYLAIPIQDRSKHSMLEAMKRVIDAFPKGTFQSVTSERGKEFACYREIEALGIPFYFADPYCAWQRGSNENSNGLLREFFPKGSDLSKVEVEELQKILLLLNHRPRKCLGFRTPFEMLFDEISKMT